MNAFSFPENYLFKEGKGFREGLAHYIYDLSGAGGSFDKDNIYLHGGDSYSGYLLLANAIDWIKWTSDTDLNNYVLKSESLDLSEYSKLYVEMACYSTSSRNHSIGIINEEINGQTAPALLQRGSIAQGNGFSVIEKAFDTTKTRQIYSLDISNLDIGTIAIRTGDYTTLYNTIFNIWLE